MNIKNYFYCLCMLFLIACKTENQVAIDRESLVRRNNPHITAFDSLSSLSVGNGEFAITVDATGLQTFPDVYKEGVPLGTQSQWGWHSFINKEHYRHEETLQEYDFGRGKLEPYAAQSKAEGRKKMQKIGLEQILIVFI